MLHTYSCTELNYVISLLVSRISPKDIQAITGNLLGDGNISYSNITRNKGVLKGNCRYAITVKKDRYEYISWLYKNIYRKTSFLKMFIVLIS